MANREDKIFLRLNILLAKPFAVFEQQQQQFCLGERERKNDLSFDCIKNCIESLH